MIVEEEDVPTTRKRKLEDDEDHKASPMKKFKVNNGQSETADDDMVVLDWYLRTTTRELSSGEI